MGEGGEVEYVAVIRKMRIDWTDQIRIRSGEDVRRLSEEEEDETNRVLFEYWYTPCLIREVISCWSERLKRWIDTHNY